MRELVTGHRYALRNLKSDGETILQFYQDPDLHDGVGEDGPSTQEVIRACIARVKALDAEKPWAGNAEIIRCLRLAIAGFEARAMYRSAEKDEQIEVWPVGDDGHISRPSGDKR